MAETGEMVALPQSSDTGAGGGADSAGRSSEQEGVRLGAAGGQKDAMTELLHWSIEHSDPEKLKEVMKKYQENNLTIKDVYGQDLIDALFVDEAGVMKKAIDKIADFRNTSMLDDELEAALYELQEMVEQVDNAGNLHTMGGLQPLFDLATGDARNSDLQALALWTLGIAMSNNAPVQQDALSLNGTDTLITRLALCSEGATQEVSPQYCGKLLFALSGLVRNNMVAQQAGNDLGLFDWLLDSGARHSAAAVVKKALGLLDTALAQSPELSFLDKLPARQDDIATTLVGLISGTARCAGETATGDVDLAEKAFRVLNRLLSLRPMLFGGDFRHSLQKAAHEAIERCERAYTSGDEICKGLEGLKGHADLALAARQVSDEDL